MQGAKDKNGDLLQPAPPYQLSLGMDWQKFSTPPYAGGLRDQPIQLMRDIKTLLNVQTAINSFRQANDNLTGDALVKWYGANKDITKFVKYLRGLEENAANE